MDKKKQPAIFPLNPRPFENFIINYNIKHLKFTECSRKRFLCTTCYNTETLHFIHSVICMWAGGSEFECQWEEDFPHPSRLALEPTVGTGSLPRIK
jgi:hypothetical protein